MSRQCINGCGIETNNPDGICTICRLDGIIPQIKTEVKHEIKAKVKAEVKEKINQEVKTMSKKQCQICKKDYQPTSNSQKWCNDCSKEIKRERDRKYREQKRSQVSQQRFPREEKERKSQGNIGPKGGRETEPESMVRQAHHDNCHPELVEGRHHAECLGQLLYASDLLDGQLNNALDLGIIDTKIILDIRSRLGAVLRGSVEVV